MIIFLSILSVVLLLTTIFSTVFMLIFARRLMVVEDDLSEFNDRLLDANTRLEEVLRIRILMTHPTASQYVVQAFEELKYCQYIIMETVKNTKLIIKGDYSTINVIERDFPKLINRLENNGTYDAEEDGGINVIPVDEYKRQV